MPVLTQRLLLTLFLTFMANSALGDWINLTGAETAPNIAEIYVLDDRVRLALEVYIEDLESFKELIPNDWVRDNSVLRPSLEARMEHFAQQVFAVIAEDGERLPARLVLVEPRLRVDRKSPYAGMINPITRMRVPEPPADKRVLYAELEYPFPGQPEQITLVPPLDADGGATTTIGFIAYHKAVPVIDFRYLGQPERLRLDWADPWYTRFENPNLKRHHKSALMSFLYVEPYEVRHEILARVKDMGEWMDLQLRGREFIEKDELEPLKQRIGAFLLGRNPLTIDGRAAKPILERSNYVKVSLTGIKLVEQPERLEVSTAIVGVIITYLTDGLPGKVEVDWDLFTDQLQRIPTLATDPAGPLPGFVAPDDNLLIWNNFLKKYKVPVVNRVNVEQRQGAWQVPLLSLLLLLMVLPLTWYLVRQQRRGRRQVRYPLAGLVLLLAGGVVAYPYFRMQISGPSSAVTELNEKEATKVLQALLKNIYRAFDFRAEEDVYDKLALTVSGDLLADIYLQNRRSFAVQQAGGAQAKVRSVEILEVDPEVQVEGSEQSFNVLWNASGSVGHWGHVHVRNNQYRALITLAPIEGSWRITGLQLLQERRLDASGASPATVDRG